MLKDCVGIDTDGQVAGRARNAAPGTFHPSGSKSALLAAVVTAAVRGDAKATPLRQRPVIDAIRREEDSRRQLAMYGSLLAEVNPRLAPLVRVLREAASGDPDTAAALESLNANRLDGMTEFGGLLHDRGALCYGRWVAQQLAAGLLGEAE